MGVASYFEFVTTLFAWILYQEIWAILVDTGIVFIPIITMVVGNIAASHRAGDDEGSAAIQSLKKIESDFFMMLGVLVFAGIPALDVELGEMHYVKPALRCGAAVTTIDGTDTGTNYDRNLAAIAGETGAIPIWWAAAHALSKSVTAAAIASIPCAPDLASVEYRLAQDSIDNPALRREVNEFTDDCYRRANSRLLRTDTSALTLAQLEDTRWLGSTYFQITPGYYNRYYAQNPQALFPYDATRDAGYDTDALAGGHPNCVEWWRDAAKGVRRKVLDSIDPVLLDAMVYDADNLVSESTDVSLSTTEREDVFLRKYLAINRVRENLAVDLPMSTGYRVSAAQTSLDAIDNGGFWESVGGVASLGARFVQDTARTVLVAGGAALKAPEAIGEGYMIRQGVSMFQALALMMIVIILPFLLVFSQYKFATLFTLTIIFAGLHFMSFLWGVAYWMDNNLMSLMTEGGRYGVFEPLANPVQSGIILWLQRFLYLIFPILFMTGLGWIGIHAGQLAGQFGDFGNSIKSPGSAGGAAAKALITKGKA